LRFCLINQCKSSTREENIVNFTLFFHTLGLEKLKSATVCTAQTTALLRSNQSAQIHSWRACERSRTARFDFVLICIHVKIYNFRLHQNATCVKFRRKNFIGNNRNVCCSQKFDATHRTVWKRQVSTSAGAPSIRSRPRSKTITRISNE